jgi:NADPH2:quinone reductase
MKAVRIHEYGDENVLRYEDISIPPPARGQALITVEVSGVNFIDVNWRIGRAKHVPLPFTLGHEGAGVVEALGPGDAPVRVGDRVAWMMQPGSYATKSIVGVEHLVPLPKDIDAKTGAALMLQGLTAHALSQSVHPIALGESCLIQAAAGGIGLFLCQMAKMRGARVIGVVSRDEKVQAARDAGADEVIVSGRQDVVAESRRLTAGAGVDVVFDGVGKDTFERSLGALRKRGMLVLFGQASGAVPPMDPATLTTKGSLYLTRPGIDDYTATRAELLARANELFDWVRDGRLRVHIEKTYPLRDAALAHRALESRTRSGKLLLTV